MTSQRSGAQTLWQTLWEDNDLLVVSKPVGMLVDSGRGTDDLVTAVGGGVFAFHRLDRDTSGIVLLGKTKRYAREISNLFEEKRIRKAYMAVVSGEWKASRIEVPIENRLATTTFRRFALGTFANASASWIEALPKTGRTHQIRIHCSSEGNVILGDQRYGDIARLPVEGQALHAYRLDFRHPADGKTIAIRSAPDTWRTTWLANFDIEPTWKKIFVGET